MRRLLLALGLVIGLVSPVAAQEFNVSPAVGGGSFFAEEEETFDTSNLFAAVQLGLVDFRFLDVGTGVAAEAGYSDGQITYSLWNLNRAPVVGGLYTGTDVKFISNYGEGTKGDFDLRLVIGYKAGKVDLEVYSLEENRPIAFAIIYRF